MGLNIADWYSCAENVKRTMPDWAIAPQWIEMCKVWDTESWRDQSRKNTGNRGAAKGTYSRGSLTMVDKRKKMEKYTQTMSESYGDTWEADRVDDPEGWVQEAGGLRHRRLYGCGSMVNTRKIKSSSSSGSASTTSHSQHAPSLNVQSQIDTLTALVTQQTQMMSQQQQMLNEQNQFHQQIRPFLNQFISFGTQTGTSSASSSDGHQPSPSHIQVPQPQVPQYSQGNLFGINPMMATMMANYGSYMQLLQTPPVPVPSMEERADFLRSLPPMSQPPVNNTNNEEEAEDLMAE